MHWRLMPRLPEMLGKLFYSSTYVVIGFKAKPTMVFNQYAFICSLLKALYNVEKAYWFQFRYCIAMKRA